MYAKVVKMPFAAASLRRLVLVIATKMVFSHLPYPPRGIGHGLRNPMFLKHLEQLSPVGLMKAPARAEALS